MGCALQLGEPPHEWGHVKIGTACGMQLSGRLGVPPADNDWHVTGKGEQRSGQLNISACSNIQSIQHALNIAPSSTPGVMLSIDLLAQLSKFASYLTIEFASQKWLLTMYNGSHIHHHYFYGFCSLMFIYVWHIGR